MRLGRREGSRGSGCVSSSVIASANSGGGGDPQITHQPAIAGPLLLDRYQLVILHPNHPDTLTKRTLHRCNCIALALHGSVALYS